MTGKELVKKAPNAVTVICVTVFALAILASLVYLSASGKDATEISRFVNVVLNFAMLIIGGVGAVAAGAAAKTADDAKSAAQEAARQTNGPITSRLETMEVVLQRLANEQASTKEPE